MKPRVLSAARTLALTSVAVLMLSGCTGLAALTGMPNEPQVAELFEPR